MKGAIAAIILVSGVVATMAIHSEHGHGHGWGKDYYHEPKYGYQYGVKDAHTGDIKSAQEVRNGGWTRGSYTLLQPDGVFRTVNYVADPHHGFRASVHNHGWAHHPKGLHHE